MSEIRPGILDVRNNVDVMTAQTEARRLARGIGFSDAECEQVVLAASELAANLVRHAGGGRMTVRAVADQGRRGIAIDTEDEGPGIASPGTALADGFSTAGGLGTGLGTVHRIMDELDFTSRPSGGLKVSCRRWLRPQTTGVFPRHIAFGVATRARHSDTSNGDAFVVKAWADGAIAAVIDGLGHGEEAERAAQAARGYVEEHFDQPLNRLFEGVALVCHKTRGVVMAIARFDLELQYVQIASIGNVEVRLLGGPAHANIVVRRGILGANAPKPVVTSHQWTDENVLVLHSDGVRTRWGLSSLPHSTWTLPTEAAAALLRDFAKEDDDATVVVVRSARR